MAVTAQSPDKLQRGQLGLFGVICPAWPRWRRRSPVLHHRRHGRPWPAPRALIFLISMVGMGATASSLAQFAGVYPSAGPSSPTSPARSAPSRVAVGVITVLGYIIAFGGIYIFVGQLHRAERARQPAHLGITQIVTDLYGALVVAPVIVGLKFGVR